MQKLRFKVRHASPNGMVLLHTEKLHEVEFLNDGKKITEAQAKKLKDKSKLTRKATRTRPFAKLHFIPLPGDKTVYKAGEIYEVTISKAK